MTDTDRLTALLHPILCEPHEHDEPNWTGACETTAVRLIAAGVTLAAPAEGLGDRMYEALKDGATAGGSYDEGWRDALDIAAQWLWLDR